MAGLLALISFVVCAWLTHHFVRPSSRFHILDHPNERSLHGVPTPRSGGVAILTAICLSGIIAYTLFNQGREPVWIGLAGLLVAAVSFLDDRGSIHPGYRIIVHLLAAFVLLLGGLSLGSLQLADRVWVLASPIDYLISLLFVVWMVNLYNFMDGMDGFAGGMAVVGFGSFALLGWWAEHILFCSLNLLVAGAALGFLRYNFPPARIFMGDVGSSVLGLLAAAFSLWGNRDGIFPFWLALMIFSPFIVDATVTLLRRIILGEAFLRSHRSHYYQRLVQLGWGHKKTVLAEYGVMLFVAALALLLYRLSNPRLQMVGLILCAVLYVVLALLVHRLEYQHKVLAR